MNLSNWWLEWLPVATTSPWPLCTLQPALLNWTEYLPLLHEFFSPNEGLPSIPVSAARRSPATLNWPPLHFGWRFALPQTRCPSYLRSLQSFYRLPFRFAKTAPCLRTPFPFFPTPRAPITHLQCGRRLPDSGPGSASIGLEGPFSLRLLQMFRLHFSQASRLPIVLPAEAKFLLQTSMKTSFLILPIARVGGLKICRNLKLVSMAFSNATGPCMYGRIS